MTNKAVLISIRPKWCELIASGKKTVEVRKTAPHLKTPFKCYMYMSAYHWAFSLLRQYGMDDLADRLMHETGTVIGEFVCDCIKHYITLSSPNFNSFYMKVDKPGVATEINFGETCLTEEDFFEYASGKDLFGWHISNLKIYDQPKQLSEFMKPCEPDEDGIYLCAQCKRLGENYGCGGTILRPPQSWCYVEVLE